MFVDDATKDIMSKERLHRTRATVLQSSGKVRRQLFVQPCSQRLLLASYLGIEVGGFVRHLQCTRLFTIGNGLYCKQQVLRRRCFLHS